MNTTRWTEFSEKLPELAPEIFFMVDERLYNVSPDKLRNYFNKPMSFLGLNGNYTQYISVTEAVKQKPLLGDYYKNLLALAEQHNASPMNLDSYFELRFEFSIPGRLEGDFVYPMFYMNYSKIHSFFSWIKKSGEKLTWFDMDQNWQFDGYCTDEFLYLKESYPDDELAIDHNFIDEDGFNVYVPLTDILPKISVVESQVTDLIAYLTSQVGLDVWTSYPFPSYGKLDDMNAEQLEAFKNSSFSNLAKQYCQPKFKDQFDPEHF